MLSKRKRDTTGRGMLNSDCAESCCLRSNTLQCAVLQGYQCEFTQKGSGALTRLDFQIYSQVFTLLIALILCLRLFLTLFRNHHVAQKFSRESEIRKERAALVLKPKRQSPSGAQHSSQFALFSRQREGISDRLCRET